MIFRLVFGVFLLASFKVNAKCEWAERAEKSGKDAVAVMQYIYCAEEENDAKSQYTLGTMFYKGVGINAPDFRRAIIYFAKSAQNGYALGQSKLALMYWRGEGITKSVSQAHKWLYLAQEALDLRWFYAAGATYDPDAKSLFAKADNAIVGEPALIEGASRLNTEIEAGNFQHKHLTEAGKAYLTPTEYKALESYLETLDPKLLTKQNFNLTKYPILNILKNKIPPKDQD